MQARTFAAVAVASLGLVSLPAFGGPVSFSVVVDTSSVNATAGFLDFQFNPGGISQSAAAQILNFASDGTLTGAPQNAGDVSGTLPATVSMGNLTALNEVFQGFTYGSTFSFTLTLGGAAIDSPNGIASSGSTFSLGLFDSGQNPILTDQVSGAAGTVDINLDGSTTATTFPIGSSVVTISPLASGVPEPGTLALMGLAIGGLALLRRIRTGPLGSAVRPSGSRRRRILPGISSCGRRA